MVPTIRELAAANQLLATGCETAQVWWDHELYGCIADRGVEIVSGECDGVALPHLTHDNDQAPALVEAARSVGKRVVVLTADVCEKWETHEALKEDLGLDNYASAHIGRIDEPGGSAWIARLTP